MAEEGSTALLPCQLSAMDNLLWELRAEHKVLQERAPWTPVLFEQGKSRMFFGCPSQPNTFQKILKPFTVSGKEERAGLTLMVTVHQLFFITFLVSKCLC